MPRKASSAGLRLLGVKLTADPAFSARLAGEATSTAAPTAQQLLILLAECRDRPALVRTYEHVLCGQALSFVFDAIGVEKLSEVRLLMLGGLFEVLQRDSSVFLIERATAGLPAFLEALVKLRTESPDAWTLANASLVTCVLAAAQGFFSRFGGNNVGNLAPYSVPLSIICVAVVWGTEPHAMTWTTRRALGRAINAFAALLQRMEMGSLGLGSLLGAQPSSGPAFAMERLEDRVTAAFAASAVAGPIVFLSGPDDIRRIVESVTPADMAATLMASVTETEFATSDDGQDAMASAALSAVGRMPGQLLSALTDEDTPAGLPSQILLKRRAQLRAACDSGLHLRLLSLYKGDDSSAANVLGSRARIGRGPKHKHIAFVHTAFEQLWTHTSVDQRVQLAEAGLLDALASRAAYFVTMSDSIVSSFAGALPLSSKSMADVLIVRWVAAAAIDSPMFAAALRKADTAYISAAVRDLENLTLKADRGRFARAQSSNAWRYLAAALGVQAPVTTPRCAAIDCVTPSAAPVSKCSRCRVVHYCSAAHQRADWRHHRSICSNSAGS